MTESRLVWGRVCLASACVIGVFLSNPAAARAQLPAPWLHEDVGATAIAGSASSASGVFTVRGSGADIWGTADGFHFVYQPLTGDGQIIARVDSLTAADIWSKAGVMMRDGVGPNDAHAYAMISASGAVRLQRRRLPGATSESIYKSTASMPYWVRLVRTGSTFKAYFSTNGTVWINGGSTSIVMNPTIYVGLAVTSHTQQALTKAVFRSVSVTSTAGNRAPTVTVTAPPNGAAFDAPATITIGATASDPDGTIQQVQFFNGTALLGTDTTSPYSLTASNVAEGTYTLKAVAVDNKGATASSSVGVTVRPGSTGWLNEDVGTVALAGSAAFSFNKVTVRASGTDIWGTADSFHFVYQTLDGDGEIVARVDSLQMTNGWAKAGVMMRETLSGISSHAFALQSAANGVGFERRTIPGGTSIHTSGSGASAPRWLKLARRGSTFTASESADGAAWIVVGSQTIAMPATIYAGLAATSHNPGVLTTAVFSSMAVREAAAAPNQAPAVSITTPTSGASFTAPATIAIAASASDADGSVTRVQFFSGSTLLGTDTTSPYSFSWMNVAAGTYSLTAVARDNLGATRTSAAVSVTVTAATGPPTRAVFKPSPDHAVVSSYLLEVYRAGEVPGATPPVKSLNMGKPAIVNGEITVNIESFILALAPGSYIATVSAVNAAGSGRSAPPSPFVR